MKSMKSISVALILTALVALSACNPTVKTPQGTSPAAGPASPEVSLQTSDGFTIAGSFKQGQGSGPLPACLLVHQLGRDMSTYSAFADQLAQAGISSLAIDLRGHGKSTNAGAVNYNSFTEEQWYAAAADLNAGLAYLRSNPSVDPNRIGIVGASIGANFAVMVAADDMVHGSDPAIACMVLLSPGVNYHGVQPLSRAYDLGHMPVMIVSGTADSQSYGGSQALSNAARGAKLESFNGRAHGTDLLAADPTLPGKIIDFIKSNIKPRQREPQSAPPPAPNQPSPAGGQ